MLNERARSAFSVQSYEAAPDIEGVEIVRLRRFNDDGGSMTELGRLSSGVHADLPGFSTAQINFSELEPAAIKAYHVHLGQTDVWYVPPASKMLVVLADVREGSASEGVLRRFVLGDANSLLLRIPPGVAHGVRNLRSDRGQLIYFVDRQFDPAPGSCDEGRLPWDHFGAEVWDVTKG